MLLNVTIPQKKKHSYCCIKDLPFFIFCVMFLCVIEMTNPIIFMYKNNIKHRRHLIFLRCQNCLSESYSSYDKYFYYILYIFAYCTYNYILRAQSNVLSNKNNIHNRLFAFSFPQKRKHIQSVPHFF